MVHIMSSMVNEIVVVVVNEIVVVVVVVVVNHVVMVVMVVDISVSNKGSVAWFNQRTWCVVGMR